MSGIEKWFEKLVEEGKIPQTPMNYDTASYKMYVAHLEAENAALRERLEKAVELPVKVGDTVWLVGYIHVSADAHLQCVEAKITDLMMMKDLVRYGAQEGDWCHEFTNDAIGEWVFITREAAEARLAEPNGGKNE